MLSFFLRLVILFNLLIFKVSAQSAFVGPDNCKINSMSSPDAITTWSGGCSNGYANGFGVQIIQTKSTLIRFEGNLKNGHRDGYGTLTNSATDYTYSGGYKNSRPHGYGEMRVKGVITKGNFDENSGLQPGFIKTDLAGNIVQNDDRQLSGQSNGRLKEVSTVQPQGGASGQTRHLTSGNCAADMAALENEFKPHVALIATFHGVIKPTQVVMYQADRTLQVNRASCRNDPSFAETERVYTKLFNETREACRGLATDAAYCVPIIPAPDVGDQRSVVGATKPIIMQQSGGVITGPSYSGTPRFRPVTPDKPRGPERYVIPGPGAK